MTYTYPEYRSLAVQKGSRAEQALDLIRETNLMTTTEAVEYLVELGGLDDLLQEGG
jgi:hypothetical protein